VLVVGAGPTGLTLACSLLLHGISVRVIDRAPGPAVTSRANFLHARGSEVLDRLGALGTLPDESLRGMQITTYLGDRPIMTLRFGDPGLRTAAPPMLVSQAKIEAALRDRLAELGGVPEWNRPLVDLQQDKDGVTVVLGVGESVRTQWVVGCDGTGSATRKLAGIGFPGVKLSERFLLADLRLDWDLDRSGTTGWIHPTGMIGAMPMPDPGGRNDLWRLSPTTLAMTKSQLSKKFSSGFGRSCQNVPNAMCESATPNGCRCSRCIAGWPTRTGGAGS
jgi:2-polyprenyl-6-methoxyphenol hydroxylase-like FAD-dependent oxidoreductase